uniref:Uncharacterized protein n=1 Tax=Amphimedon queenslandica TaxID=400682 RepID=A0A1X7SME9_AMPQE
MDCQTINTTILLFFVDCSLLLILLRERKVFDLFHSQKIFGVSTPQP